MLVNMRAFVLFGIVPDLKLAEKEGFEPSLQETCKPDFESGAFDHSATSPFYRAALEVWQVRQVCHCSFFKAGLFSVALLFLKNHFRCVVALVHARRVAQAVLISVAPPI